MREHENAEQVGYRGYKIVKANGSWLIYDTAGFVVGGAAGFQTAWSAITYIDEMLAP